MKVYRGWRDKSLRVHAVVDDGRSEHPLRHFGRDSSTGFEFGYGGFATADLARSVLGDFLGSVPSTRVAQKFKRQFLEPLDDLQPWAISGTEVAAWLVVVKGQDRPDHH